MNIKTWSYVAVFVALIVIGTENSRAATLPFPLPLDSLGNNGNYDSNGNAPELIYTNAVFFQILNTDGIIVMYYNQPLQYGGDLNGVGLSQDLSCTDGGVGCEIVYPSGFVMQGAGFQIPSTGISGMLTTAPIVDRFNLTSIVVPKNIDSQGNPWTPPQGFVLQGAVFDGIRNALTLALPLIVFLSLSIGAVNLILHYVEKYSR